MNACHLQAHVSCLLIHMSDHIPTVADLGSLDLDVVLVRRTISSGKPRGAGKLEWGGDGEGEVSLRATWSLDRITPKEGFQVSKREMEGGVTKN
jgi:hypothetical protein